ncbi:MAG: glycosyltransferase [Chromatiales bacterium]|nr:glycosyltransferase [Chromatiales bacterium]
MVPAYNESEVLPRLVARLMEIISEVTSDFEIIIVNDGSSDASERILAGLATEDSQCAADQSCAQFR